MSNQNEEKDSLIEFDRLWKLRKEKLNKARESRKNGLCGICWEKKVNRRLDPCGHTVCDICVERIVICPDCRTPIEIVQVVYIP